MNEPLKFKLFSVYGKVLHKDVLTEAFRKVKKNKGCAGIDKVSIKMFEENLDDNIDLILNELRTKTYRPSPVRRKYIPKKKWKAQTSGNTNY
jgi:RNA-directed DNA polymerase